MRMEVKTMNEPGFKLPGKLFVSFLKIGPLTFGGGYSSVALIEREVVDRRHWLSSEDVADLCAVAQTVPGAIGANAATLIGYRMAGVRGAVAALAGMLLPTFAIVLALSMAFLAGRGNPKVEAALTAMRPAVVALIVYAAYKVGRTALVDWITVLIFVAAAAAMLLGQPLVHPLLVLAGGAAAGIAAMRLNKGRIPARRSDEHEIEYMI
ncbi:Chromate transport protein [Paenibacillus pasadenensis]|uniref:Chromate transport protein n=2 Tax=Paenibacillus pasadenensis TaxID=217090 RepID=A0A2N5N4J9_9BACL|nr:Chromate transport protein [Paenibacillus pasadenensis]